MRDSEIREIGKEFDYNWYDMACEIADLKQEVDDLQQERDVLASRVDELESENNHEEN